MQVQEITNTTEAINIQDAVFEVRTFEMLVTGFCDICGKNETGSKTGLENRGWYLGRNEHLQES